MSFSEEIRKRLRMEYDAHKRQYFQDLNSDSTDAVDHLVRMNDLHERYYLSFVHIESGSAASMSGSGNGIF